MIGLYCFHPMGFILEEAGDRPEHPSVFCTGAADLSGRGWAWHDDPRRQRCFSAAVGDIAASAPLVAMAISGFGVDGMLAIAQLAEQLPGAIARLFPRACPACDGNHFKRAIRIRAAVKCIHEAAIPAIRAANVAEYLLRIPYFCSAETQSIASAARNPEEKKRLLADPDARKRRLVKRVLLTQNHLPFWAGNPERTRVTQIAFAHQYRLRKGM